MRELRGITYMVENIYFKYKIQIKKSDIYKKKIKNRKVKKYVFNMEILKANVIQGCPKLF